MEKALKKLTLEFFGKGKHKIKPEELFTMKGAVLLDVRTAEEVDTVSFGLKHHRNIEVLNIPLHQLPDRLREIPEGKPIALFCSTVVRSAIAYAYLLEHGFSEARIFEGGYATAVEALKPKMVLKVLQGQE
jgi:rhodanese-related sulfurtransferase